MIVVFFSMTIFTAAIANASTTGDDIKALNAKVQMLENRMKTYEREQSAKNGYCEIQENKCGTCTCIEDLSLVEKYYCDCQDKPARRDCREHYDAGERSDGVYRITMNIPSVLMQVYCDQTTDGGGWTVFQRRLDGSVNFYRGWDDYKKGFGRPHHEHWLGNQFLFLLTAQAFWKGSQLRVEMMDRTSSVKLWAKYLDFEVDDEKKNYMLHIRGYSGTASDQLSYNNNMMFSTYDRDNDKSSTSICAKNELGGWWYKACTSSNLNGAYDIFQRLTSSSRIVWIDNLKQHLKFSEMKVRRNQ